MQQQGNHSTTFFILQERKDCLNFTGACSHTVNTQPQNEKFTRAL